MWSNPGSSGSANASVGQAEGRRHEAPGHIRPRLKNLPTTAERYRRSQVLGLLLIAAVILVAALFRADKHALFPPGWWRF